MTSKHVYVVDDDAEVRRSLHFLLSTAGYVSWPFSCASDFLENVENLQPAPILLDIRMPHLDGIALMNQLHVQEIKWPIIVMTAYADISIAVAAIKLGALDLLEKPLDFKLLETNLQTAFEQLSSIINAQEITLDACRLYGLLSPREIDVMAVLMDGCPNKVAAYRLSLSVRTVEMHRANALQKLHVKSIAEAVRLASEGELDIRALTNPG